MNDIILSLSKIEKSFGETVVLRGVDLDVAKGEFITLLGPSGCGKTTVLRIIAGLIDADSGTLSIDGADMTGVVPEKRPVNTVFQNYALFPHMTVAENVGYALKLRGVKKAEIKKEVERVLSLVRLSGYEKRRPHELSGGQRQRVAIARSVIAGPKVLLLDEPLGALDLQLRRQMQIELKHIQQELGITFIYITHDQEEALNMSSRIAVMRGGVFEQVGDPSEIYDRPKTAYVARFVGEANILRGRVVSADAATVTVNVRGASLKASRNGIDFFGECTAAVAVRRENLMVSDGGDGIPATVKEKSFAGGMLRIVLDIGEGEEVTAAAYGIDSEYKVGDRVFVSWEWDRAVAVIETDEE